MPRRRLGTAVMLASGGVLLTVAGCSSSEPGESAFTPPPDPSISVGASADDTLASINALHVCFVQNSALPDLAEIQADLDRRLQAASLTEEEYNAFQARAASEPAVRTLILEYYNAACGPSPEPTAS